MAQDRATPLVEPRFYRGLKDKQPDLNAESRGVALSSRHIEPCRCFSYGECREAWIPDGRWEARTRGLAADLGGLSLLDTRGAVEHPLRWG